VAQEKQRKKPSGKKKSTYKRGSARKKRMRAKRQKTILRTALIVAIAALVLFAVSQLLLFLSVRKYDGDTAMEGVYIGNLHVGGMTLKQMEEELDKRIVDSSDGVLELKVSENTGSEAVYSELGISVDAKGLAQEALDYGKEGSLFLRWRQIKACEKENYVIPTRYAVDDKAASAVLEARCGSLYQGATDATIAFRKGKLTVTEGENGSVLDVEGTIKVIEDYLNSEWDGSDGEIHVKSKTVEPRVHANDLAEVKTLIGTYKTTYEGTDAKSVINIETGAKHLHGTIVMPGEEFSVNAGMEPYTEEAGYVEAGSYANGEVVYTMGGGICQVSTTMYNALLFAELEITERFPHSMIISYVEPAMDAAIAGDIKDLKFKNNLETAIYIECITKDSTLTVNIYGKETRDKDRTIAFESEILEENVPEKPKFVATDDKVGYFQAQSRARIGYQAKLWKIIYEDGEEVSREEVNNSYYKAAQQVIGVGIETDDAALKQRMKSAIATQDEQKIRDVMTGRDLREQEKQQQEQQADSEQ